MTNEETKERIAADLCIEVISFLNEKIEKSTANWIRVNLYLLGKISMDMLEDFVLNQEEDIDKEEIKLLFNSLSNGVKDVASVSINHIRERFHIEEENE